MQNRARSSILGGSLAVGSSTAFRLVTNFAIAVLVARLLGAEAKGQLALLQQFPAITALLLGLGFCHAQGFLWSPAVPLAEALAARPRADAHQGAA